MGMRSRNMLRDLPSSSLGSGGRQMCIPITSPVPKESMNGRGLDMCTFCPVTSLKPYE